MNYICIGVFTITGPVTHYVIIFILEMYYNLYYITNLLSVTIFHSANAYDNCYARFIASVLLTWYWD